MVPCAAHLHPGTAVVVGGMVLDVTASPGPHARLRAGSSTPGAVRQNPGGVARNIAEGLARLVGDAGPAPLLISAVGDDVAGRALIDAWRALGGDTRGVRVCTGASTPVVATVLDHDGEVAASVADTLTAEKGLDASWIAKHADSIGRATVLVLDGNCAESTIAAAVDAAERVVGRVGERRAEAAGVVRAGVGGEVDSGDGSFGKVGLYVAKRGGVSSDGQRGPRAPGRRAVTHGLERV